MTKTEFTKTVKTYKKKIDDRLKDFLNARIKKVDGISDTSREMMEHILEYNLRGGKRIRPILVVFGYKAFGGKGNKAIVDAALAVELMESFLLIHDDIMDQDYLRRGKDTMHKIYEKKCNKSKDFLKNSNNDAIRYGENMALISGDILAILGCEAIINSKFPIENKLKAINKFNSAVVNTCFGQALDVDAGFKGNMTEDSIKKIYELKTAIYTFEAPLHIGALLAGANKKDLDVLTKYSMALGKAFQYQDDILGLFGNEAKIGKPVASDLREGKRTLLILKALEKADKVDRLFIERCLGYEKINKTQIEKVRQIVVDTGSLDYSKDAAKELAEKAKEIILKTKLKEEGKRFLTDLADYVIEREY